MLGGEATNTNCIVFGLTRTGLEPTIYRTRGEHANHYTTNAVILYEDILININLSAFKTQFIISGTDLLFHGEDFFFLFPLKCKHTLLCTF